MKMEYNCDLCKRNFNSEESMLQHNLSKHPKEEKKGKINLKRYAIVGIVLLIVLFSSLTIYSQSKKPGALDDFVNCLNEKGVVVYGNDFCSYTMNQLGFFGKSKKNLNYVKCFDNQKLCEDLGIKLTPTWKIGYNMYEEVKTIQRLSTLSGCVL